MTLIYASIALAFALYYTVVALLRIIAAIIRNKDMAGMTENTTLACMFWGMFYYCTHI